MATDLRFVEELDRDADRAGELSHSGGVSRGKGRGMKLEEVNDQVRVNIPMRSSKGNWRCRGKTREESEAAGVEEESGGREVSFAAQLPPFRFGPTFSASKQNFIFGWNILIVTGWTFTFYERDC